MVRAPVGLPVDPEAAWQVVGLVHLNFNQGHRITNTYLFANLGEESRGQLGLEGAEGNKICQFLVFGGSVFRGAGEKPGIRLAALRRVKT